MSRVLPSFDGFDKSFEKNITDWEKIYASASPQSGKVPWPGDASELSWLRRVLVLRILRPDKVVAAIRKLIAKDKEMGKPYTSPPPFDL
jgi:hypothetical protein